MCECARFRDTYCVVSGEANGEEISKLKSLIGNDVLNNFFLILNNFNCFILLSIFCFYTVKNTLFEGMLYLSVLPVLRQDYFFYQIL